jgi:hypothetical protein
MAFEQPGKVENQIFFLGQLMWEAYNKGFIAD